MYEEMKFWSSTLVVKEGDVMIVISSAAKGMSSSVPVGAQQPIVPIQVLSIGLTHVFSTGRIMHWT